jgi:hypothetical protein
MSFLFFLNLPHSLGFFVSFASSLLKFYPSNLFISLFLLDLLLAGRFRDRIPVEAGFFAPAQAGPGAHPASCTMDI